MDRIELEQIIRDNTKGKQIVWTSENFSGYHPLKSTFFLGEYLLGKDFVYQLYIVLHEIAHSIIPEEKHGKAFKLVEKRILREYGISVKYAKKYPSQVFYKGELAFTR